MVFPSGARSKELAADHLDRLLGKSRLDWLLHERRVTQNADAGSSNEPEGGRDGVGDDADWDGDDCQSGVELGGSCAEETDVKVASLELSDTEHAANDQDNVEEEKPVGQQGVNAEHDEEHGIVAGEIAQVVVYPILDFAEVLWFGKTLEVKELGDGLQVGEAVGDGLRAHVVEAAGQVETGRESVEGNIDAVGHLSLVGCERCSIYRCRGVCNKSVEEEQ